MAISALAPSNYISRSAFPNSNNSLLSSSIYDLLGNTSRVNSISSLLSSTDRIGSTSGLSALNSSSSTGGINGLSSLGFTSTTKTVSDLAKSWYNEGFKPNGSGSTDGAKSYLTTIKSASQSMKGALSTLMGGTKQSAFQQLTPVSSDNSKLKVEYTGGGFGSVFDGLKINVDQVATGQTNKGEALAADDNAGGPALYEFKVGINGKEFNLFVNTDASDTNETLQNKIAAAINEKNIGVTAQVAKDAESGMSALTVKSNETGDNTKSQFTIQDVYGDAIARTGADTVTEVARDAIYRINNGDQKTSASNTLDLGNGVRATMLEASENTIDVSMKSSGSAGDVSAVKQLVSSYNDLIDAAKGSDTGKALQMNYQLASLVNTYATSLNRVGIEMDTNGKMSVNTDKLNAAADNGTLRSFFDQGSNANYGFGNRLSGLANDINSNPMKYTDLSDMGYANFNNSAYSPFQASRYNQVYNTGLFLNMFV